MSELLCKSPVSVQNIKSNQTFKASKQKILFPKLIPVFKIKDHTQHKQDRYPIDFPQYSQDHIVQVKK